MTDELVDAAKKFNQIRGDGDEKVCGDHQGDELFRLRGPD